MGVDPVGIDLVGVDLLGTKDTECRITCGYA